MKQIKQRNDAHKISLIILAVIVVGVLCYAAFRGYVDSAMRNANSSVNNDKDVAVMQRQVEKGMQKSKVDEVIGAPYACTDARPVKMDGEIRETWRCSYGNPDADEYLNVVYIDAIVWGTSQEGPVSRSK